MQQQQLFVIATMLSSLFVDVISLKPNFCAYDEDYFEYVPKTITVREKKERKEKGILSFLNPKNLFNGNEYQEITKTELVAEKRARTVTTCCRGFVKMGDECVSKSAQESDKSTPNKASPVTVPVMSTSENPVTTQAPPITVSIQETIMKVSSSSETVPPTPNITNTSKTVPPVSEAEVTTSVVAEPPVISSVSVTVIATAAAPMSTDDETTTPATQLPTLSSTSTENIPDSVTTVINVAEPVLTEAATITFPVTESPVTSSISERAVTPKPLSVITTVAVPTLSDSETTFVAPGESEGDVSVMTMVTEPGKTSNSFSIVTLGGNESEVGEDEITIPTNDVATVLNGKSVPENDGVVEKALAVESTLVEMLVSPVLDDEVTIRTSATLEADIMSPVQQTPSQRSAILATNSLIKAATPTASLAPTFSIPINEIFREIEIPPSVVEVDVESKEATSDLKTETLSNFVTMFNMEESSVVTDIERKREITSTISVLVINNIHTDNSIESVTINIVPESTTGNPKKIPSWQVMFSRFLRRFVESFRQFQYSHQRIL